MVKIREGTISDIDGITKVHIDTWKSTYKGLVADSFLEGISFDTRKENWKRYFEDKNNKMVVCLNEDEEVIGFAAFSPQRSKDYDYENELSAIYIFEKYQRMGLGKLIIKKSVELMKNCGVISMIVWVLKDNESFKFYEHLGGEMITEDDIEIGGKALKKVGYGWKDISKILDAIDK